MGKRAQTSFVVNSLIWVSLLSFGPWDRTVTRVSFRRSCPVARALCHVRMTRDERKYGGTRLVSHAAHETNLS